MNAIQYLAALASCSEEFYHQLPDDWVRAYDMYFGDPVEFVRLLLYIGIPPQELDTLAESCVTPFPRWVTRVAAAEGTVAKWQCARNCAWASAMVELLKDKYPLQDIAPKILIAYAKEEAAPLVAELAAPEAENEVVA